MSFNIICCFHFYVKWRCLQNYFHGKPNKTYNFVFFTPFFILIIGQKVLQIIPLRKQQKALKRKERREFRICWHAFWNCVKKLESSSAVSQEAIRKAWLQYFYKWISFDDKTFFNKEKEKTAVLLSYLKVLPSTLDPLKWVDLFLLKYPFLHLHS